MKKKPDTGFAIVTAIFLLVVLGALGAFMVTLSGVHQTAPTQALNAGRVYYGAKAGLDWGVQQAVAAGSCAASTSIATFAGGGLDGVSAVVTCSSSAHTGGNVYVITSTAQRGSFGGIDYARRQVRATVTDIP